MDFNHYQRRIQHFIIVMIIVAVVFAIFAVANVNGYNVTNPINETNLSEMFHYQPPQYDQRPFYLHYEGLELNETGHSQATIVGDFFGGGNISVVANPPGWDLVFQMFILQTVSQIIIAIGVWSLVIYFWFRLHK